MNVHAGAQRRRLPGGSLAVVALASSVLACQGCGPKQMGVDGRLTVGPGLLLVERGELHNGIFEIGVPLEDDGTFSVDIPAPGPWGLHFYIEDYFYLPVAVTIEEGKRHTMVQDDIDWDTLGWFVTFPQNPEVVPMLEDLDVSDNPVVTNATIDEVAAGTFAVSLDVNDPTPPSGDLSVQILLYLPGTGVGIALNPPGPPIDGFYPNGTYTATLYEPAGLDRTLPWSFLAADRGCSMSEILELVP